MTGFAIKILGCGMYIDGHATLVSESKNHPCLHQFPIFHFYSYSHSSKKSMPLIQPLAEFSTFDNQLRMLACSVSWAVDRRVVQRSAPSSPYFRYAGAAALVLVA